jgi:molybdate transport system regulatory protein
MDEQPLTVRLHLWLEKEEGICFGMGLALLLVKVDQHGSLKKAADELGMSYRAAWGKIKESERILGVKLIAQSGSKKEGYHLTEFGASLKEKYLRWFKTVEKEALRKAQEVFPWATKGYED